MQPPTTTQFCTAIEVLKGLVERVHSQAEHAVMQVPESSLGFHYTGRITVNAIEQITRIGEVASQLKNWHDEILEQQRQHLSHHV